MLKIKWFGHSMWQIETEQFKIITDPFDNIGYPMPQNLQADIVSSSHAHHDHNNFSLIKEPYKLMNKIGIFNFNNLKIEGFQSFHDDEQGNKRGLNTIYKFSFNNISIVHCGDLGHIPHQELLHKIEKPDFLMIPVGGTYTIDSKQAAQIINTINPYIILPMHYKNKYLNFNIDNLDAFKNIYPELIELKSNEYDFSDYKPEKQLLFSFNI